jgi:N-acetylglucosamine-6-phosphate deacetylase
MRRRCGNYKNFLAAKRLQSTGEATEIGRVTDGEIFARHYATGQPGRVSWRQGIITACEAASTPPDGDVWLAPALVDLQVNGFAGVDFQQDNVTVDQLLEATRALRAFGCARYLLTLITDEWPKLTARLKRLRQLRRSSLELERAIAGWHVEGPFLSAEPGFHGAHNPALMLDPAPDHIRELRAITDTDPLLLTIAPERQGALEAIALATSLGVRVSLGHTNASAEILRQAVRAGATGFTHLGNACPQQLDRHDNILWRVLDTRGLAVSLIPDQIHVSPALFRLIHRALPSDSICYITDAMAAAGASPGRYTIGSLKVVVGEDQIVRQPGGPNYAGSALRPMDGVFRAAQMLGCPWQDVWDGFSIRPARFAGFEVDLVCGRSADFCLIEFSGAELSAEVKLFVRGAAVERRRIKGPGHNVANGV